MLLLGALSACGQAGAPRAEAEVRVDLNAATADLQARAGSLRASADQRRHAAETAFEAEKRRCYDKFLVNGCIADAKEVRLAAIRSARAEESEAAAIEREVRRRQFEARQFNQQVQPAQ